MAFHLEDVHIRTFFYEIALDQGQDWSEVESYAAKIWDEANIETVGALR